MNETPREIVVNNELSSTPAVNIVNKEFSSSPIVNKEFSSTPLPNKKFPLNFDLNCSASTIPGISDNEEDQDYLPEPLNETNSSHEDCNFSFIGEENDIMKERKFVLFESKLIELLKKIPCPKCTEPMASLKKLSQGTCLSVKTYCPNDHLIVNWDSQPFLDQMPAFNLICSASTLFSGATYERVSKVAEFSGLNFVNHTTYYNIQRNLLLPVIEKTYQKSVSNAREEVQDSTGTVLGDGRFDSPGKSAKYCSYSCQDPKTKKILVTKTVQTTKGKGSSPLELKGFQQCVEELEKLKFNLTAIATDRNKQIAKWIRENRKLLKDLNLV